MGTQYGEILKNWFQSQYGWEIDPKWNSITPGVVFALAASIRAFTRRGDSVLIQEPVYYPFRSTIEVNGRTAVSSDLVEKNGHYEIDFEDFERKAADPAVKLFLLCSPHNPVGRVWTREELTRIGEICLKHDVLVFADEIHCDFVRKGYQHTPFASISPEFAQHSIIGTAASKTFNIAALQTSNVLIPNPELRKEFHNELDRTGFWEPNVLGYTAVMSVYTKGQTWLSELKDYIEGNLEFVRSFLEERLPQVRLVEPEGTYLIWLDFGKVCSSAEELQELVEKKARLWLDEGSMFSKGSPLYERINLATQRSVLQEAMERLEAAIKG